MTKTKQISHDITKAIALHPTRIQRQEYAYTTHYAVPPAGTRIESLEDPSYWSHIAQLLRPCDRIEVDAEDGAFYAKFKVNYCDKLSASVTRLEYVVLGEAPKLEMHEDAFTIRYNGPHAKWGVIRVADKVLLATDMQSKEEADVWLKDHIKVMAK